MQFMSVFIGLLMSVSISAEPLLEGRVRLESGQPVADAQVQLFDLADLRRGAIARAMTDGTGYFALPLAALAGRALPERFALGQNYPNPFNPSTIIPYQLAASSHVRLEVFNLLGQRIATLVDGERPAGFHTATWHAVDGVGRAVGAGVYIYRMMVGVEGQTGRMVLVDGQAGVSAAGAASVLSGVAGGGSDRAASQVYGLIVSGAGLAPYVDSSFRVEAGMAPVELVVSSGHWRGKAADDDCAFCDLFDALNDDEEGLAPAGKAVATRDAPAAPTNLRFDAPTDSSCTVRWDAVEGATDYDVNYKRAVGGQWTNEPHRGVRLYNTIHDLAPRTEYRWAVRAENRDGVSAWVFGPNFTTLEDETDETTEEEAADGQAPAAPTNLRFEAGTDSSCTVRWDAVEGATDYDVNYKPAVGGRWTNEPHSGTGLYNTIHDLAPRTEYRWAVRAENRDGVSAWVFGPNFTTLEDETTEEEVAEDEVVRSGQAPIDYPDRWMDDLPEHDVLRIELVYLDDFPQWQKDEMRWAADLWELAFTRKLPNYDVAEHDREWLSEYLSSQSVSGQPVRVPNVIDDVLVYVIKIPDDDPYSRKRTGVHPFSASSRRSGQLPPGLYRKGGGPYG